MIGIISMTVACVSSYQSMMNAMINDIRALTRAVSLMASLVVIQLKTSPQDGDAVITFEMLLAYFTP